MMKKWIVLAVLLIAVGGIAVGMSILRKEGNTTTTAEQYDIRVLGKIGVSHKLFEKGAASWITFKAEDAKRAGFVASKLVGDLKGFGDIKAAQGPATSLSLEGTGYWIVGLDGVNVQVLFAKTSEALADLAKTAKASSWTAVDEKSHPRWLDRFDNDAVAMGFLGFGALPQDIDDEIKWMGEQKLNIAGNTFYAQDCLVAPGVYDYTIPEFYSKVAANNNAMYVPYTVWATPWRPTWVWNRVPLPHIIPEDGTYIAHNKINEQRLAGYNEFEPIKATDPYLAGAYREQAEQFASLPNCNMQFGYAEVGHNIAMALASYAGMPEAKEAWHNYLKSNLGYDLAKVGQLYKGNANAYTSWDQVEMPTIRSFTGWNPQTSLDLRGIWNVKPGDDKDDGQAVGEAYINADTTGWTPMRADDPILLIYAGRHGSKTEKSLWMKKKFTVTAEDISSRKYAFLHVSRNNWHGHFAPDLSVYVNGKPLKNLTKPGMNTDFDLSYETGNNLVAGENVISVDTHGQPIPGYIFFGAQGRWNYPSDNEHLNRLYFDAIEFASHYRMQGVELALRSLRSGDPQGRPLQVMAVWDFVDLTFDMFKKYGAYAHDTGQGGGCWAPWMNRYYTTRGLPISSEPGGPPGTNVPTMRKSITLWTLLGDDSINLLFDPSQYSYRDKNAVGGWIENNAELLRCIGKMEVGRTDVGVMRSLRNASRLHFDYPWWMDLSRGDLQSVGRTVNMVDPSDFAKDYVNDWFPVVFDAGSKLLTEEEVSGIERYVRNGGTFIAFEHTGTHSPEKKNSWPISRISGLKVVQNEGITSQIKFSDTQTLWPSLKGKEVKVWGMVYDHLKTEFSGNSIGMEAAKDDVEVIAEWVDRKPGEGRIAIAARKIGKGRFITVGANFWRVSKDENGRYMPEAKSRPYLDELLTSLNVPANSYRDTTVPDTGSLFAEHWTSKNGLYDLYILAKVGGENTGEEATRYDVGYRVETLPTKLVEISAQGHPVAQFKPGEGRFTLEGVELLPMQLRIFAAPRADIALAPLEWIKSVEKRWYTLPEIPAKDVPAKVPSEDSTMALNEGWNLVVGGEKWGETPPSSFDWSKGKTVKLGTYQTYGLESDTLTHFRKEFTIPASWKGTRVRLSFASVYWNWGIIPNARLWVNGKLAPITQPLHYRANGSFAFDLAPELGDKIALEIEIDGKLKPNEKRPRPSGVTGVFMAQSEPQPVKIDSLNGQWTAVQEIGVSNTVETGTKAKYTYLEKKFTLPPKSEWVTKRPFLESPTHLGWVILNGRVVATPGLMNRLNVSGLLRADGSENVLRWVPNNLESLSASRKADAVIPELNIAWWPNETK